MLCPGTRAIDKKRRMRGDSGVPDEVLETPDKKATALRKKADLKADEVFDEKLDMQDMDPGPEKEKAKKQLALDTAKAKAAKLDADAAEKILPNHHKKVPYHEKSGKHKDVTEKQRRKNKSDLENAAAEVAGEKEEEADADSDDSSKKSTSKDEPEDAPLATDGAEPEDAPLATDGAEPEDAPLATDGAEPEDAPLATDGAGPEDAPLATDGETDDNSGRTEQEFKNMNTALTRAQSSASRSLERAAKESQGDMVTLVDDAEAEDKKTDGTSQGSGNN